MLENEPRANVPVLTDAAASVGRAAWIIEAVRAANERLFAQAHAHRSDVRKALGL